MFRSFKYDEKEMKKEIIVLTNLKNKKFLTDDEFIPSWERIYDKEEKEKNKTKEEIEKEVKKEICEEIEKIKEKSLKTHYKIDNQKINELEKTFKSSKSKVVLKEPINLQNGNICSISGKKIILYENKNFNKLFEIKTSKNEISSVIQLDNNDIIISTRGKYYNILIYRLKDNEYSLFLNL